MKEYRIDAKVRNNLILSRMEKMGFTSVAKFCSDHKISTHLFSVINLKMSPLQLDGQYRHWILKTADLLQCSPEDLFSDVQLHSAIKSNRRMIEVNEAEMKFMLESKNELLLEDMISKEQMNSKISESLETLLPREQEVLKMRFGIDGDEKTLEECGKILNVNRERIRQIEARALRKLRNPLRAEPLRGFLEEDV
jgi:RNA polymerase primary sigma factor